MLLFGLLALGSGGNPTDPTDPAPTVSYDSSTYSLETDDTATLTPTLSGGTPTNCTSDPALPAGLAIDGTNCAISGTPTAIQAAADYTITATNAYGDGTATINIEVIADGTAPSVTSSTPDDTATDVAPNSGTITVVFDDYMDTSLTPTLTTEAWSGSSYVSIPNTGTTFTWSDSKTLNINISWIYFPENVQLRWTLNAANLKDNSGNVIAADVQRTFTTTSRNTYFPIADTGQNICYYLDVSTWTADPTCTQTYSTGSATHPYGQDAHYANIPNTPSFTGPTAHSTYSSDYTTTDNVTGLVWKSCSEGTTGAACSGSRTSVSNFNGLNACASNNSMNGGNGYAGRTDWRLPTAAELLSIRNYISRTSPLISAFYFPGTTDYNYNTATNAYNVVFNLGSGAGPYVRCVAGGVGLPARTFSNNEDGSITDNATGLTWQACQRGQTWSGGACSGGFVINTDRIAALNYCNTLTLAGKSWRLPSTNEIVSLVDYNAKATSYLNPDYFPGPHSTGNQSMFHTSTNIYSGSNSAYVLRFSDLHFTTNITGGGAVRCVTGP